MSKREVPPDKRKIEEPKHKSMLSSQLEDFLRNWRNDVLVLADVCNSNYTSLRTGIEELTTDFKKMTNFVSVSLMNQISTIKNESRQIRESIENNTHKGKVEKVQREILDLRKSLQKAFHLQETRNRIMVSSFDKIEQKLDQTLEKSAQKIAD